MQGYVLAVPYLPHRGHFGRPCQVHVHSVSRRMVIVSPGVIHHCITRNGVTLADGYPAVSHIRPQLVVIMEPCIWTPLGNWLG